MFEGISNMKNLLVLMLASLSAATATAQKVTPLLTKPMPEQPGRQIEVITVDFAPGAVNPVHRHNAHAVVYVLNGELEMQVRGGTLQHLGSGQAFYEGPNDVHTVARNASKTKPAKFVVFLVKDESATLVTHPPDE
jgi:quercetin dioxygenase-like cupin family protein